MSLETTIAAGILFLIAIGLIACAIKEDKKERARAVRAQAQREC